jgi:galactose mutarotase-like enzyme
MPNAVTIRNDRLTATIAAKGAELQSLVPAGGTDVIWEGDPAVWGWHAPNLFPIVGALADDQLLHMGRSYPIKQHGFLRHSVCAVVLQATDTCALRLTDNDDTRAQYPFAFELTITYRTARDRLECEWSLQNPATATLYASVGLHPAFRRPLGKAARDAHVVLFDKPEPAPIRRLAGRQIDPAPKPTPVVGRVLHVRDELFDADAIIFNQLASRKLTYGAPGSPAVELDFPDFPDLGIWAKPGATPFLCLEPWQGMASPRGFAGEFSQKPGVIALAPGETRTWRYAVRPLREMPALPA